MWKWLTTSMLPELISAFCSMNLAFMVAKAACSSCPYCAGCAFQS
ncbi:MAG: hypothetical protein KKD74_02160 [Bacteroidetes bacterium]|nr:hypothetical protein [Bacteroidota bacterium]